MNLPTLPNPQNEVAVAGDHDAQLRNALEDYYDTEQVQEYARNAICARNAEISAEVDRRLNAYRSAQPMLDQPCADCRVDELDSLRDWLKPQ